jgi:tetraacyldisaccharide 4'-kinase
LKALSAAYGQVARMRRSWYERHPQSVRHLDRPVVSVGNLSVGGSGKTPVVAALARLLLDMGERPAILSRGYGRRRAADGVVVVSDGVCVREPVERTGDEPQMLARALPGVPVLVSADRYLAGRLAERQLACRVLLLDDGFQHLQLAREVDLLVLPADDLTGTVVPSGRLREALDAASAADGLLVPGTESDVDRVRSVFTRTPVFKATTHYAPLRSMGTAARSAPIPRGRVVAVAGVARPGRFFAGLRAEGYDVVEAIAFGDHHWFTGRDLARIEAAARDCQADTIVTTEKDAARLSPREGWATFPMTVVIEPAAEFAAWIRSRL